MNTLLNTLRTYNMIVDIHIDYLNSPEIIYFRFHENPDINFFVRGLIQEEEFILHIRIGLKSTYINLGNWRQLSNRDFLLIQSEYEKMSVTLNDI